MTISIEGIKRTLELEQEYKESKQEYEAIREEMIKKYGLETVLKWDYQSE